MKKIISSVLAFFIGLSICMPSYANAKGVEIERLSGKDRYITAISISKEAYEKSDNVILASGENFPDALSGGQLALALKAPILLTERGNIDKEILDEISRLSAKKVYILGGASAVSNDIENELKNKYEVERIGGHDRYATAKMIMEKTMTMGKYSNIVIATGKNYPDALSATVLLKNKKALLFLSDGNSKPDTNLPLIAIGGKSVLPLDGFTGERISGENRYETALEVSKSVFSSLDKVILASGDNFPDALTSVSLVEKYNLPIILTASDRMEDSVKEYIGKNIKRVIVVGGEKAVSNSIVDKIGKFFEKDEDKTPAKPLTPKPSIPVKTDAEKTVLKDPVKVEVKDLGQLSKEEKTKVEEAIKVANPQAPIKSILVETDGKAEVTYNDGSKIIIPAEKTVLEMKEMIISDLKIENKARWDYHFTGKTLSKATVNIFEGYVSYGEPKFSGIAGDDGSFDIAISKNDYKNLIDGKDKPFDKTFLIQALRKDNPSDKIEKTFTTKLEAHRVNLIKNSGIAVNLTENGVDSVSGATKINYFKGDKIKLIFNQDNLPAHKVFNKWDSDEIEVPEGEEKYEFEATGETYNFIVKYKDAPVPEPPADGHPAPGIWTVFKGVKKISGEKVEIKLNKSEDIQEVTDQDWLKKFHEGDAGLVILKNDKELKSAQSEYSVDGESYYIKNYPMNFKIELKEGDRVQIKIPGFKDFVFYYHDNTLKESI